LRSQPGRFACSEGWLLGLRARTRAGPAALDPQESSFASMDGLALCPICLHAVSIESFEY
ncbi:MAG TPA: hypothetical protein VFT58_02605, partial [Nitrososphaera sp.]|nr:hypothetical protein [Nitrososphaera sp.]